MAAGMGTDDCDSVADVKAQRSGAQCGNMTSDLVPERERDPPSEGLHKRSWSEGHSYIAMAESISCNLDKYLAGPRRRNRGLREFRWVLPLNNSVGLHHFRHGLMMTWPEKSRPVAMGAALTGQDVSSVTRRNPWLK